MVRVASLLLLALAGPGCASLEESLFGWGEITDDPARLHQVAKVEIEAASADPEFEWQARSAVRKLRHLRERFPEYGQAQELEFLQVRGRFASGEWNLGFTELKSFAQRYPLAERPGLQFLLETYGERALDYHPTFLGIDFVGTEKLGENMLAFLTTQFPSDTEVVQRAQQRLANYFYDRDQYGDALLYYDRIVDGPRSAWTDFASFRRALCLTRSIGSRDLDAEASWAAEEANLIYPGEDGLTLAARLFQEYLEQPDINFRAQAERALELALEMLRDRELDLAGYYDRLGNAVGRAHHEREAARHQARLATFRSLRGPAGEGSS